MRGPKRGRPAVSNRSWSREIVLSVRLRITHEPAAHSMLFLAREGVSDLIRQALEEYAANHQLAVTDPQLHEAIELQAQEFAKLGLEMEADDFLNRKTPQQKLVEIQQQLTDVSAKPVRIKVASSKRATQPKPATISNLKVEAKANQPTSNPTQPLETSTPTRLTETAPARVAPNFGNQEAPKPVKNLSFGPGIVEKEPEPVEPDNFALTLLKRYSADEDQY